MLLRYIEKTNDIGNPYLFEPCTLSEDSLPPMLSTDIFNYLVLQVFVRIQKS